ncbi:uncharacterized protein LOC131195013 [Ahaetulla prasina]|uniref:uncharacterized protein LOC131195013 n=1 Tax=Ahaetulla prasina TaxID=499056 RepID=UPI0026490EF4|nr:uncharacterized protein LOC131195013 [Ahaetulla prasina]
MEYQLKKKWLKASADNLKIKKSKEPGPNILRWLQQSLKVLKEDSSEQKTTLMSLMTLENKELQNKAEMVTFKNLELTDEKEELCREYEERLWRETQLRKGCCTLLMGRDRMDQRPGSSECKRGAVSVCQTSADVAENKTEAQQDKMKPQMEYKLNKKWLKASVDNLKIKKSKEPEPNILRWLQQSLKVLKEDSSEQYTLPKWLKASISNLPKECAETSREDVNGWLEGSINHLQEEGPETCDLDVQGWLEASIIGIQHLLKSKSKFRRSRIKGMA